MTKKKIGFYLTAEDAARARAAYLNLPGPLRSQYRSLSDYIAEALITRVRHDEEQYNNGEPWDGLEPGQIPTGRPLSPDQP